MYKRILIGLTVIVVTVALMPSQQLPFWRAGQFSDVLISHWPNAQFVNFALDEWGQVPLWNPTILSGMPFAADPLSGLWYPPNWLAVLLPSVRAFNALFLTHLLWGAIGMWSFVRRLEIGKAAAIFSALVFALSPKLIGHIGLGHLSWVMASAWVPWTFLCFLQAHMWQSNRQYALTGATLGLVFLIDPRWVIPLGLMMFAFSLREIAHSHINKRAAARGLLTSGAFSIGVAAVGMLPLLELIGRTTRVSLTLEETSQISISFKSLLGLLIPEMGAWPETQTYVGLWVVVMAIVALIARTPRKYFWLGVIGIGWLIALGDQTPFFAAYSALVPGASLSRVPARFLSVVSVPVAVLAGYGIDTVLRGDLKTRRLQAIRFILLGLLIVVVLNSDVGSIESTLAILWIVVIALLFFAFKIPLLARNSLVILTLAFATLDLTAVNLTTLELRPANAQFPAVVDALSTREGRIFSPSYSVPTLAAARHGLQLADGVNPLQLQAYWDFMAEAIGFEANGYSVTLPPYPDGDPSQPRNFTLRSDRLRLLAVDTIVSSYPLDLSEYQLADESDQLFIYTFPSGLSRAWIETTGGLNKAVTIDRWSPNQIDLSAVGPGMLVLSEMSYPGWHARVDGEPQAVETSHDLLRSIDLPNGRHEVTFRYTPWPFWIGMALTIGTLLVLALYWRRA
jgi:hypothetical protein